MSCLNAPSQTVLMSSLLRKQGGGIWEDICSNATIWESTHSGVQNLRPVEVENHHFYEQYVMCRAFIIHCDIFASMTAGIVYSMLLWCTVNRVTSPTMFPVHRTQSQHPSTRPGGRNKFRCLILKKILKFILFPDEQDNFLNFFLKK